MNSGNSDEVVIKPGPFVCEWCGTIFKTLDGTRIEDNEIIGVGYCVKCKCKTWTCLGNIWIGPAPGQIDPTKEMQGASEAPGK